MPYASEKEDYEEGCKEEASEEERRVLLLLPLIFSFLFFLI
ncbi:MAG: hypothetical protein V1735_00335 [Nanoarchaeota archaeon]